MIGWLSLSDLVWNIQAIAVTVMDKLPECYQKSAEGH
jgi:hypothetical protein